MDRSASPEVPVRDPRTITDLGEFFDSFTGSTQELIRSERDYLTFRATQGAASGVHMATGSLIAFVLFGLAILISSLGLAVWLGRELDNVILGFVYVGAGYAVAGIVFLLLWRGALGKRFKTSMINSFHGH